MSLVSALLTALYLQAGLAADQSVSAPAAPGIFWDYDLNKVRNPYGVLELGFESDPYRRLQFQLAARHASSLAVGDHGINSIEARLTWRPFRK